MISKSRGQDDTAIPIAALRCWSNRTAHACGCETADDCLLCSPLPVHDVDQNPYRARDVGARRAGADTEARWSA